MSRNHLVIICLAILSTASPAPAEDPATRGYRWLRTRPYLPADFDQAVFDRLWTNWPAPDRKKASAADQATRRRMTLDHYGLMPDPDAKDPTAGPALGHVPVASGGWAMNCLTCHAGRVDGRVIRVAEGHRAAIVWAVTRPPSIPQLAKRAEDEINSSLYHSIFYLNFNIYLH